ncbi:MAG: DoxX family protein [Gemmatimonadota bacterium]
MADQSTSELSILVLRLGLAGVFLIAGGAKLAGAKSLRDFFEGLGLPGAPMYAVGAAEVAGGVGLLWPPTALWAAGGLSLLMLGAIGSQVRAGRSFIQTLPPVVVFAATSYLIFLIWSAD